MLTRINERSWAIDVISEINQISGHSERTIKRAGGERTISAGTKSLFPDVLLFAAGERLLQGWELKMPDTPISDSDFVNNAAIKAKNLKLNSFLLWNVSTAVLYVQEEDEFVPRQQWTELAHLTKRSQVEAHRADWRAFLHTLLLDLNNYFEKETTSSRTLQETFSDASIVDLILENTSSVAAQLQQRAAKNARFRAETTLWWKTSKNEFGEANSNVSQWNVLARTVLVGWLHKFLFAHVLKTTHSVAATVEQIIGDISPIQAVEIFENISAQCDFWSLFSPKTGEAEMPPDVWSQLLQLNGFLAEWQFQNISQEMLQTLLQSTANVAKRKVSGQYTTPTKLAQLLVRISIEDLNSSFYDPFCGTGTIARAAYLCKKEAGQDARKAMQGVWASDKFSYPLQFAALSLSEPANRGEVLRVFQHDTFNLQPNGSIVLQDPNGQGNIVLPLPQFSCIASNLPFVPFEERDVANPLNAQMMDVISKLCSDASISARADLYAFAPFALWPLLEKNGRLGIIISNSWLATEWGNDFRRLLNYFYHLETVVTSGKGRWFQNAQVVTNLVVLRKRSKVEEPAAGETTAFVTLEHSLEELEEDALQETASAIVMRDVTGNNITVNEYSNAQLQNLPDGLQWNALFADLKWVAQAQQKLIPASSLFEISRGERRGWDALFYPSVNNGIEPEYLKPVLKSSREIQNLVAESDGLAFCCSRSIAELEKMGHNGALSWIRRFEFASNEIGKPLPEVLWKANLQWYEMSDNTLSDLVTSMNPEQRIFLAKMKSRSFVNQRLIRFSARNAAVDTDLCHALFNSSIGIFFLESLGFGRGLGALDLNATKLKNHLPLLNPILLSVVEANRIKKLFSKLLQRPIKNIEDEMKQTDRIEFDNAVLAAYGLQDQKQQIHNAFKTLYIIRLAVKE